MGQIKYPGRADPPPGPAVEAGRREIAKIARLATALTQRQCHRWRLPRKKRTQSVYKGPGYAVSYQALARGNLKAFATRQDTPSETLNHRPPRSRNRPGS